MGDPNLYQLSAMQHYITQQHNTSMGGTLHN